MSWDVDGNGLLDPLTDGRLVLLYLLGLRDRAVIENSVATDATRTTFAQIIDYLDGIREELDIDGNGAIDALTDGVLNYRRQLGLIDDDLIRNAIGAGATRSTAAAVTAYLDAIANPQPDIVPIDLEADLGLVEEPVPVGNDVLFLGEGIPLDELIIELPDNVIAADTTNTNQLWSGGGLGLNLDGNGLTVGVWEATEGKSSSWRIRDTHQEFNERVTIVDEGTSFSDHATHVAGTIGAAGVDPQARGMANRINLRSYSSGNDIVEMERDASLIAVSNHSYGLIAGWWIGTRDTVNADEVQTTNVWFGDYSISSTEDTDFGKYKGKAQALDRVLFNNPNLLSVWSAGNDRNNKFQDDRENIENDTFVTYFSSDPGIPDFNWIEEGWYQVSTSVIDPPAGDGNGGRNYDSLNPDHVAKNTLVVGAINDITADPYDSNNVLITSFSNWGPTDDGRIKPDVVGNGARVFSPVAFVPDIDSLTLSDTAYDEKWGTSMAAPNVAGTAALLIEHYNDVLPTSPPPRSATTKGLLIHTASDAGKVGPDYTYGWGVVDGAAAANFLTDVASSNSTKFLSERSYTGNELSLNLFSDGSEPLKATIVWTDPEGAVQDAAELDDRTPVLVNNLDLWITDASGNVFYPWTLDPENPEASAQQVQFNTLDNVEQVLIDAPVSGNYTIHVGNQTGDTFTQDYSLLISGIGQPIVNQPPVAINDSATVDFQTSAIIDVLANDTDENGDRLSISGFSLTSQLSGAIAREGDVLRYTPASGFSGNDSFRYSISDGNGGTDSATVNVTVSPAPNQPPVAVNDSASMTAGTTATINAIANDNDPDGDALNITGLSNPLNGSANINGNQAIYIPGQSPSGNPFTGRETFTYTISDGRGGVDSATISVTVNPPPNSVPVAVNDAITVNGGGTTQIAVLTNDSDSDGDNLSISGTSPSVNGGTIVQNGNELVYTTPTNFSGSNDSFIYSISDGRGGTDSATVNVTILNSPPVANNDAATVPFESNATLAVLANDSDPNGDSISISGLASISANGGTISQNGNQLVYSPPAEFSGNDSFTYSIADVRGAIASATVNLTVSQAPNNVPVAVNDSATVNSGETVNIPVLINDSDPDGDLLSISGFASTSGNGGTIIQSGNQLAYTASASFTGNDSFSYSISDGRGGTDSATVNVTVVNSSPVANDDSATVNAGETVTLAVLANDSDPDGDSLSISGFSARSAAGAIISQNGSQLQYSSPGGFSGNDSFSYSISDGKGGTDVATVNINVLNQSPVAVDDGTTVNVGETATLAVLANDSDPDGDILSISGFSARSAAGGTIFLNGTELQYAPLTGFSGLDNFSYSISDGKGGTDVATVNINVLNQSPVAVDDATTLNAGATANIAVLTNDSDPDGDNLSISGFSARSAAGGTISQGGNQLQYSSPGGFSGSDSFSYSISDGRGGTDSATVNVTVLNQSPVAVNDAVTVNPGENINISVLANDADADGDNLFISGFSARSAFGGTISQGGSQLQYTPPAGFRGNDSFNYSISDGKGGTDVATVTINVLNRSPVANNDVVTLLPASTGTIDVLANDTDPDGDALQIATVNSPSNGTVVISNNQAIYSPAAGFSGNDSFSYAIVDGNGGSDSATVNVTVGGNQPPVANNDAVSTIAGGTTTIAALLNDSDPDPNTNLSITGVSTPTNGGSVIISNNGTPTNPIDDRIVYISPNATFTGTDSFTYSISDQAGGFDSATVSVTVNGNQPPVANNDAFTVAVPSTSTLDVLENDSDPNVGDSLRIIGAANNSSLGSVTFTSDRVIYTPNAGLNTNFFGSDSFTYTIADVVGVTATATGVVTLGGIQPPDAIRDTAGTSTGIATTIDVLANDTDPSGNRLVISSFGSGANGTVSRVNDQLVYSPNATFIGTDSFTYTVTGSNTLSDGSPLTDSAVVTVIVSANLPPVANPDIVTIQLGTTSTINVLDNDFDPNGGALSVVSAGGNNSSLGTVSVTNGQVLYRPNSGLNDPFVATDSFIYSIQDVAGAVDTAVVTVTLGGNQPPTAINDTVIAIQTIPTTIDVLANDTDSDAFPNGGTLSITGVGTAANGTVNIDRNGTDSDPTDDKVIYTSTNPTFTGTDSFVYSITDSNGTSGATVSATVNVIVNQNGAPIANPDTATVLATGASTVNVLSNDSDPNTAVGDILSVTGVGSQSNTAAGSVALTNGQVIYTSAGSTATFTGTDSFTYTISDISGNTSTASVSVTVGGPQPPIANPDTLTVTQGSTATLSSGLTSNDSDPNGDVFSIVGVSPTTTNGGTASVVGGQVIYNAPTIASTDTFTYSISDATGTSSATVAVTLNPSNAPIAVNDIFTAVQGITNTLSVLANDSDPDGGALAITGVSTATNGIVTISDNGTPTVSTDDVVLYSSNSTTFTGTDSFTYTIADGQGGTDSATVRVTVEANQGPTANNDSFTLSTATTLAVLDNDTDPNPGDTLSVIGIGSQANAVAGTVALTGGNVIYIPNASAATGATATNDSFTYTISDISGNTSTASVSVTVGGPQPPVANPDSVTATQGTTQTLSAGLTSNDSDPNGDAFSIVGVTAPTSGGTTNITSGQVIYNAPTFVGTDTFIYSISDGTGTDSASVTVSVIAGSATPVANNDYAIAIASTSVTIPVLLSDSDPNGDTLSITGVSATTNGGTATIFDNGTPTISSDDQIIYTGATAGVTDTFTYSITDGNGGTDTATVSVGVFNTGTARSITGDADSNVIVGNNDATVNEALRGGSGNDILIGRGATDNLTGGAGADQFRFEDVNDSTNDAINGFNTTEDTIRLAFLPAGTNVSTGVSVTALFPGIFTLTVPGTSFNLNIFPTDTGLTDTSQIQNANRILFG